MQQNKTLTTEEFERLLDSQQGTARLTLSNKRYSADSIDEQLEEFDELLVPKTSSDTQQLADFLRNTGPQESTKKKKGGLFSSFGKKKKREPTPPPVNSPVNSPVITQSKAKYIPLTALAYSNNNVSSPLHHPMYTQSSSPQSLSSTPHALSSSTSQALSSSTQALTREQQQILARETTDREYNLHQHMLDREKSNGFIEPPNTNKPYPLLQDQLANGNDDDEDEELDSIVLMNTEYNSTLLDVPIVSTEKKREKGTKVVFAEMVEEIGHPDDLLPIDDDNLETTNVTVGISERGSYYPTFDEKPLFNQRQSSLTVKDHVPENPPTPPPKTRTKKKIRHVQIQTRASITKPASTQTSPSTVELQLRNENAQILADAEEKAVKFDKLSSAAFKKIKELLNERKMLEIEVGSLKDQLDSLHDFQARQWNGEVVGNEE